MNRVTVLNKFSNFSPHFHAEIKGTDTFCGFLSDLVEDFEKNFRDYNGQEVASIVHAVNRMKIYGNPAVGILRIVDRHCGTMQLEPRHLSIIALSFAKMDYPAKSFFRYFESSLPRIFEDDISPQTISVALSALAQAKRRPACMEDVAKRLCTRGDWFLSNAKTQEVANAMHAFAKLNVNPSLLHPLLSLFDRKYSSWFAEYARIEELSSMLLSMSKLQYNAVEVCAAVSKISPFILENEPRHVALMTSALANLGSAGELGRIFGAINHFKSSILPKCSTRDLVTIAHAIAVHGDYTSNSPLLREIWTLLLFERPLASITDSDAHQLYLVRLGAFLEGGFDLAEESLRSSGNRYKVINLNQRMQDGCRVVLQSRLKSRVEAKQSGIFDERESTKHTVRKKTVAENAVSSSAVTASGSASDPAVETTGLGPEADSLFAFLSSGSGPDRALVSPPAASSWGSFDLTSTHSTVFDAGFFAEPSRVLPLLQDLPRFLLKNKYSVVRQGNIFHLMKSASISASVGDGLVEMHVRVVAAVDPETGGDTVFIDTISDEEAFRVSPPEHRDTVMEVREKWKLGDGSRAPLSDDKIFPVSVGGSITLTPAAFHTSSANCVLSSTVTLGVAKNEKPSIGRTIIRDFVECVDSAGRTFADEDMKLVAARLGLEETACEFNVGLFGGNDSEGLFRCDMLLHDKKIAVCCQDNFYNYRFTPQQQWEGAKRNDVTRTPSGPLEMKRRVFELQGYKFIALPLAVAGGNLSLRTKYIKKGIESLECGE
jgi:hypothetical protein